MMTKYLSSHSALKELGKRLKTFRISFGITQEELSKKSGVSRRSVQNIESGEDVTLTTLIKVLMVFDLDANLDLLIPDSSNRPSYYMKASHKTKLRVRPIKTTTQSQSKEFKWGDEIK